MSTVAIVMVLLFGLYIFMNDGWRIIQAKRNGIETDACISRIVEYKRTANGADYYRRFYYVTFRTDNDLQNEAWLLNPKRSLAAGSTVRIKYLPERNDYAVMTKATRI